ncbi:MAG: hypothetical protein K2M65_01395 [Muribaculaceae bacterium]|nr:hypothetical protein [Muribaculaceae bacterium]
MKLTNIFKTSGLMAAGLFVTGCVLGLTSCKEDETFVGDPYFLIEGAEDGVVHMSQKGLAQDKWAFGVGDHYIVRANGSWEIVPADGEMPEWMKIYPMTGKNEGKIRFYAVANPMAEIRAAEFVVMINGVPQEQRLRLEQDPAGPSLTLSADRLQLQQGGSFNQVTVTANYEWGVDTPAESWLTVTREDNILTIGTSEANTTGAERSCTVVIRGVGSNSNLETNIEVTQLDAIFFDDFSWAIPDNGKDPIPDRVAVCWGTENVRIDKLSAEVNAANPGWTGLMCSDASNTGPFTYARFNYILFGTSNKKSGNIVSPAISSIEGTVNATVSFSMAGFTSAKNAKEVGNEFWVAILGPGKIVEAKSNGTSTAAVMSGNCKIPFVSTGTGGPADYDIDLTEAAKFTIGKDGYFDTKDDTGLEVWKNPESMFSIKVEDMTNQTRIVFIGADADKVNLLSEWNMSAGSYKSGRKLFDNFKVVTNN